MHHRSRPATGSQRRLLVGLTVVALCAAACGSTTADSSTAAPTTVAAATTLATTPPITSTTSTTSAPVVTEPLDENEILAALTDAIRTPSGRSSMNDLLANNQVPGITVAIVRDGEVVFTGAFGEDPATNEPLVSDTLFQAGSISKPVAAIGAAWLGQARVFAWDADIGPILSSYSLPRGSVAQGEAITVERLLSHRAGINIPSFLGYPPGQEVPSLLDVLQGRGNSSSVRANRTVGEYFYSGGGYLVLEQTMTEATGRPFIDLIAETVLGPAGMTQSTFRQPLPPSMRARTTAPSVNGVVVPLRTYPEHSAAGLWTTAPDLASLLVSYQAALTGTDETLLKTAWAQRLIEHSATGDFGLIVGHGWFLDRPEDPQWFWHAGQNIGYNAEIIGSTDGRHGAVVMTNAFDGQRVITDVLATIGDFEGWQGSPR